MIHETDVLLRIKEKFEQLKPLLNERTLRAWCAAEALSLGRGGRALVHRATGVSWPTITRGINDLKSPVVINSSKIRASGGGRKKLIDKDKLS